MKSIMTLGAVMNRRGDRCELVAGVHSTTSGIKEEVVFRIYFFTTEVRRRAPTTVISAAHSAT